MEIFRIKGEVGFISHYRYAAKELGEQQHAWEAFRERQPPWSASSDLTRVGKEQAAPPLRHMPPTQARVKRGLGMATAEKG